MSIEGVIELGPGAVMLRAFALSLARDLVGGIAMVTAVSPLRHLVMPNGKPMAIEMTNCGPVGWINAGRAYRYSRVDPDTGHPWPPMPTAFRDVATMAAAAAGYDGFDPAVCIVNRYAVGAGLQMHQDRDDTGDRQPVVSVSLGLPAIFRFGGQGRDMPVLDVPVVHGDVAVWGGPSRMNRHGVAPVVAGNDPLTGPYRYNLTFRTARIPRR
ncbi:alpha-ketoglutarate-dependent dioxygenase AlkB [Bacillus sp. NP157]|nr:alpha-ketoglutarate-dependent dioxygenase AlkB [Bacillus sp. NP157]